MDERKVIEVFYDKMYIIDGIRGAWYARLEENNGLHKVKRLRHESIDQLILHLGNIGFPRERTAYQVRVIGQGGASHALTNA